MGNNESQCPFYIESKAKEEGSKYQGQNQHYKQLEISSNYVVADTYGVGKV